jgi:hypothetical protein
MTERAMVEFVATTLSWINWTATNVREQLVLDVRTDEHMAADCRI